MRLLELRREVVSVSYREKERGEGEERKGEMEEECEVTYIWVPYSLS